MTQELDQQNAETLKLHLDRISKAQTSIQELQHEIMRTRQDARADGYNMEAVHLLGQIRAKSPHDNGDELLDDIISFAHQTGYLAKMDHTSNVSPRSSVNPQAEPAQVNVVSVFRRPVVLYRRLAVTASLLFGLFIFGSLIVLLE